MQVKDVTFTNTIIGSLCIALSQLLFATNDALLQLSHLKITQFVLFRYVGQLIIAVIWWIFFKPKSVKNWYGDKPYITVEGQKQLIMRHRTFHLCMVLLLICICISYTAQYKIYGGSNVITHSSAGSAECLL